jgi:hypothetical protein
MTNGAGDAVPSFAPIQLGQYPAAVILVINVIEEIQRLIDAANFMLSKLTKIVAQKWPHENCLQNLIT